MVVGFSRKPNKGPAHLEEKTRQSNPKSPRWAVQNISQGYSYPRYQTRPLPRDDRTHKPHQTLIAGGI